MSLFLRYRWFCSLERWYIPVTYSIHPGWGENRSYRVSINDSELKGDGTIEDTVNIGTVMTQPLD